MNYFKLISDRGRSLTVMFDYCSEGIWGRNAGYRFSRLPKLLQKEFLKWINDTTITYFNYENNKHRYKLVKKKGFELAKKSTGREDIIYEGEVADNMESFSPQAWMIAERQVKKLHISSSSNIFP